MGSKPEQERIPDRHRKKEIKKRTKRENKKARSDMPGFLNAAIAGSHAVRHHFLFFCRLFFFMGSVLYLIQNQEVYAMARIRRYCGNYILEMNNGVIKEYCGRPLYELDGDRIRRYCGNYLYEISGDRVREYCGNYILEFSGNRVRRYCGNYILEIDGSRIREYCGNYLYEIDGYLSRRELMALITVLLY